MMILIRKFVCAPSVSQKALTVESNLGGIVMTADLKPWSSKRNGCPLEKHITGEKLCRRQPRSETGMCFSQGTCKNISVKWQLEKESISVSIPLHCARALAGMK